MAAFLEAMLDKGGEYAPRLKDLLCPKADPKRPAFLLEDPDHGLPAFRERLQSWLSSGDGLDALRRAENLRDQLPETLRGIGLSAAEAAEDLRLGTRSLRPRDRHPVRRTMEPPEGRARC